MFFKEVAEEIREILAENEPCMIHSDVRARLTDRISPLPPPTPPISTIIKVKEKGTHGGYEFGMVVLKDGRGLMHKGKEHTMVQTGFRSYDWDNIEWYPIEK